MPSAVLLLVCALASSVLPYASGHCVATKATCFRDDPEARLLPYPSRRPAPHGDLTRQTCMQLCADAGYVLAGAEDGGQCFCGNATATGAEPASSAACNMPCRGNASETCGGNDRIVVLEFQCAGPPDPSPRPAPAPSPPPSPPLPPPTPPPSGALNVLSIMVDDLRPQLGCFNISVCGGKKMVTPHIDALAERGLTFRHAYTQYAVCSPSRNSFMSGRRPDTTLTYNFKDSFRTVPARGGAPPGNAWVSYPEYFKLHGYNTTGCGKTYHSGHPKNFDQPTSWTTGVEYVGYNQGLGFCGSHAACELGENDTQHFTDDGLAARAIELMSSHKTHGISPWFVAVGFIRPHVDWSSPSRFWENYPEEECSHDVAKHRSAPSTSPRIAWVDGGYVDKKSADVGPGYHFNATTSVNDTVAALWRRGYYSAVSYVDWNIGKVLTELRSLEFEENTVVVLNADHGYQLGEHSMWEKYTNWELSARVPLIIAAPNKPKSHGVVTVALVELVDIYPTVAELAGLPVPAIGCPGCVEGDSAAPLLEEPHRPWKRASFSQYARCANDATPITGYYQRCSGQARDTLTAMGYSVRTDSWRYTEWFAFNDTSLLPEFSSTIARELYSHASDSGNDMDFPGTNDLHNVVDEPEYASVTQELAQMVRVKTPSETSVLVLGWRNQLNPKTRHVASPIVATKRCPSQHSDH